MSGMETLHGGWKVDLRFDDMKYPVVEVYPPEKSKVVVKSVDDKKLDEFPKFVRKYITKIYGR